MIEARKTHFHGIKLHSDNPNTTGSVEVAKIGNDLIYLRIKNYRTDLHEGELYIAKEDFDEFIKAIR